MTAAILITGWAGVWLMGYSLTTLLGVRSGDRARRTEQLGLALPLGIAANSAAMYVWSWAGGRLTSGLSWSLAIGGAFAGLLALFWEQRRERDGIVDGPADGAIFARLCQS